MAEIFFPHHFWKGFGGLSGKGWSGGFSDAHKRLFEFIDADPKKYPRKLIKAHREFGKSTCVQVAYVGRKLLFGLSNFIVPISASASQAIMHSNTIKQELLSNNVIKQYWGKVDSKQDFSKAFWVANLPDAITQIAVMPRGTGQQIRGLKFNQYRPNDLIFDDIEDPKAVLNPDLREELSGWVQNDAIGALQSGIPNSVIALGTVLHEDCQLLRWEATKDWEVIELPLCDENYHTLNPQYAPQYYVDEKLKQYRNLNDLDGFSREYMNLILSSENRTFKQEYFHYYEEADLKSTRLENFVVVDPARTGSKSSDDWAICCNGADYQHDKLYVRDFIADIMHPDKGIKETLEMCKRFSVRTLGVEVTGLNDWILWPFQDELIRQHLPIQLVPLHAKGRKEDRIISLLPMYRTGRILHNKAVTTKLEQQLLSFPRSAKDDASDAQAHIIQLLSIGNRFLSFHTTDTDTEEDTKQLELEYAPLADDDYSTECLLADAV